jgi:glycosyltransferase involved in cell wall biosynthesis
VSGALRLGIVATHPIQYQVPWFRALAARADVELRVYFALIPSAAQQGAGFGLPFEWDIPLRDGYASTVLANARARPELGRFFGSSTPHVADLLRRDRREAVVLTGWNALPLLQALWACIRLKIPRVVRGESNALKPRAPWKRAAHRALLRRYDAFVAIGEWNRRFYLESGVAESKIFDAPYFVDNTRFCTAARALRHERAALRKCWGIPEHATCFLFAGKLEAKKRPLDLVRAMASLAGTEAHLLVVGSGALLRDARELAERLRVPASFAGFLNQSEMPKAYVAADCLVLPSNEGETWGLVVNEAMACGLPAVVSDRVGCAPDLVLPGETGMIFPFGDVDALARVLKRLARDRQALAHLAAGARRRIASYSVERAVDGTLEAVRYVLRDAG